MMAALVRHGARRTTGQFNNTPVNVLWSGFATKAEKKKGLDRKVGPKIESAASSLAAKGFLRPQKEYNPPSDLEDKLNVIFKQCLGSNEISTKIDDINKRFAVFNKCFQAFEHGIPNSLLHTINTVEDVKKFYATPVDVKTPLERLKNMDLPENLHVQYEYHRFHPDTDTKFDGITAFPNRSTIVSGLKYKDKYKGHEQETKFPEV